MKKPLTALFILVSITLFAGPEEVSFSNGSITLAGTLLTPKGDGPFPAVVFVHGSGVEDRSNSKNRAKEFVKHGYAALIYDKRGVGKSGGDPNSVQRYSIEDLAGDVKAAVEFLASQKEVDARKIGIIASSQGGWVAPLAASLTDKVAFMVVLSGSVCSVGEDNLFERRARLKGEGFTETDLDEVDAMHLVDIQVSRDGSRFDEFNSMWAANKSKPWFKRVYVSENPTPPDHAYRKWYRTVVDVDSRTYLKELKLPVMWLYGEPAQDPFCPVALSIRNLEALKAEGKRYEIKIIDGANHSLVLKGDDMAFEKELFEWLAKSW